MGLEQAQGHSRLVPSQQIYLMLQVQNAVSFQGTDPTSQWGRHHLHRFYRRFLSCPNSSKTIPLPWLQTGKPGVLLQSYAVWAQHSSESFYKTGGCSSSGTPRQGDLDSSLPGRLDHLGPRSGGVPPSNKESNPIPSKPWIPDKLQEIMPFPGLHLRVDRPSMVSHFPHPFPSPQEEQRSGQNHQPVCESISQHLPSPRTSSRLTQICFSYGPHAQGQSEGCQQSLETESHPPSPRPQSSASPHPQKEAPSLVTARSFSKKVPLQFPSPSLIIHTDASLSGWGGHSPPQGIQGTWSAAFQQFYINILEAMTVLLILKCLKPMKKIHIRLVLDRAVIVTCLNQ